MSSIVNKMLNKSDNFYFKIGLIGTFAVTLVTVLKWKQGIYFVYNNATVDYWSSINVYDPSWGAKRAPDEYLYGPLFNFLFFPFTMTPLWMGPFLWNILSFSVFFYAVFSLPSNYSEITKKKIWLYLFPVMLNNIMYYQYNVQVAAIFLIAFSNMERKKFGPACGLINISALTKIYGGFQLILLFMYEKPFKLIVKYAIPFFIILFFIPVFHDGTYGIWKVYSNWINGLTHHSESRTWQSFFYIKIFFNQVPKYATYIQLGLLVFLMSLVFVCISKRRCFEMRTALQAALMGWMILFSSAPEIGTYLIALSGYLLWYHSSVPNWTDKLLYWMNLILLVLVPQDIICPKPIMRFLIFDLNLNLIVFSITWVILVIRILTIRFYSRVYNNF